MTQFTVRKGRRYSATIELGWLEQIADNETIAARLRQVGFADVVVTGDGGRRTAEALWPGEDTTASLPPQIAEVIETA